jgi:hypothetical protein
MRWRTRASTAPPSCRASIAHRLGSVPPSGSTARCPRIPRSPTRSSRSYFRIKQATGLPKKHLFPRTPQTPRSIPPMPVLNFWTSPVQVPRPVQLSGSLLRVPVMATRLIRFSFKPTGYGGHPRILRRTHSSHRVGSHALSLGSASWSVPKVRTASSRSFTSPLKNQLPPWGTRGWRSRRVAPGSRGHRGRCERPAGANPSGSPSPNSYERCGSASRTLGRVNDPGRGAVTPVRLRVFLSCPGPRIRGAPLGRLVPGRSERERPP